MKHFDNISPFPGNKVKLRIDQLDREIREHQHKLQQKTINLTQAIEWRKKAKSRLEAQLAMGETRKPDTVMIAS